MVVSDSQSAWSALCSAGCGRCGEMLLNVVGVGKQLSELGKQLVFVWVAGHCGLLGNGLVGDVAQRVALIDEVGCASLYKSVKCLWKRRQRVMEWHHQRCRDVYGEGMRFDVEKV